MRSAILITASATILMFIGAIVGAEQVAKDVPRLVGYGCEGSKGPLFANEEDHFPHPCDAIEGN